MIVDHGQRMQPATAEGNVALEVHLPKRVGLGVFKALPGFLSRRGHRFAMPAQDLGDGRRRRRRQALAAQAGRDLAATPDGVLTTNRQHRRFHLARRAQRRSMRTARSICQSSAALEIVAR